MYMLEWYYAYKAFSENSSISSRYRKLRFRDKLFLSSRGQPVNPLYNVRYPFNPSFD